LNDYLLSIILGLVEGVTEFLPVSSTAHLRISEALLGISLEDGFWKMFSIVIQLGPILCLPILFSARIRSFFATFPTGKRGDRTLLTHPLSLTFIAFVCTAVPSLLLKKVIGKNLENLPLMGVSLAVGGVIMWIVDAMYGSKGSTQDVDDATPTQAVVVGLCQSLAPIFPGTSRSMATIVAGQLTGFTRSAALEFSFLLSIPTMAAATGYDLLKFLRPGKGVDVAPAGPIDAHGWVLLLIGFVVSFVLAYATVAWLLNWVRTRGFVPFAIYRIVAGIAVILWAMKG
jgi:undecaprenyl-diphosphatase